MKLIKITADKGLSLDDIEDVVLCYEEAFAESVIHRGWEIVIPGWYELAVLKVWASLELEVFYPHLTFAEVEV